MLPKKQSKAEQILIRKALDQVWQNPYKDRQSIVQLARISPINGFQYSGRVGWEQIETPTESGYYHFYQMGDNYPGDFNLIADKYQWYKLSDWCKEIDLTLHFYNKIGKNMPITETYMIRLYNDNMVIAVLINNRIVDTNTDVLYGHFYRNAFFSMSEKDPSEHHIEYHGGTHTRRKTNQWVLQLRHIMEARQQGKTILWNQGYLVDDLVINKMSDGEYSEVYYDQSIRKIVDIPISSLRTFKSTLDGKHKYLIHPPKDDVETIDYRDDIDIYIYKKDKVTKQIKGLYYHRNQEDAVRMITHRDYSLPVPYVLNYVEALDPHPDLKDFYVRLYIRDNGPRKPLIEDVNMIKSLYVLPDDKLYEAMVTVDSTVPEWTADHLESSAYTALMRSFHHEVDLPLVLKAFGYSALIKAVADPNIRITEDPNGNYFKIPDGLIASCTVYEYNANGVLLGWYYSKGHRKYYPRHDGTIFIECIAGEGQDELEIHVGKQEIELQRETAYRFYLSNLIDRKTVGDWTDVTGKYHIVIDGTHCHFDYNTGTEIGVAIGDNKFLCYEKELDGNDGVYDFRLTYGKQHDSDVFIPPGKIDLWMNGHALVEDVDYFVNFPDVCIVTKEYVQDRARQIVTVRCTGFPFLDDGVLKRIGARENGFIEHGKISVNKHYDLHRDRILRTVVDGGVFDPNLMPFDEDGNTNAKRFSEDGRPFAIETPYVALIGTLNVDLYLAQIKDYELTKRIGQYISYHLPQHEPEGLVKIRDYYNIYSPFMSKIAHDIKYGRLLSPQNKAPLDVIDKVVQKYKRWLVLDPAYRGSNKDYVNIHPHNQTHVIDISARDYAFLERLNERYLNKRVDLTQFFNVRKGK